jgi:hypothetical protein
VKDKAFLESLLKLIESGRIGDARDMLVKHLKGGDVTIQGGGTPTSPPPRPPVPDNP